MIRLVQLPIKLYLIRYFYFKLRNNLEKFNKENTSIKMYSHSQSPTDEQEVVHQFDQDPLKIDSELDLKI